MSEWICGAGTVSEEGRVGSRFQWLMRACRVKPERVSERQRCGMPG